MSIVRLDNTGIIVEDLPAAIAFFVELGFELEGEATVQGAWADALLGMDGVRTDIATVRTPDGQGRVELSVFREPVQQPAPDLPFAVAGVPRITVVVDDLQDTIARLVPLGAELVGEVARYEDYCLFAYLRGPSRIVIGIVEELG
ncbi:VOC family protein [Brachybacterium sp. AOP25-B2-12]|uniref:VOC family protein n=1 Tax=Brachybacterium sp. AOP25-B2-12 TaxID=3457710 RepID=UPI004033A2CD